MIDKSKDVSAIVAEFAEKKTVTIPDFLHPAKAEELFNFFDKDMPPDWWYSATMAEQRHHVRNMPEEQQRIDELRAKALSHFHQGKFAYDVFRTAGDHHTVCPCSECQFRRDVTSPESVSWFEALTSRKLYGFGEMFASYYAPGCFLAPHHDGNNGQVGFVLNLTKDWKPQWGGCLHLLSSDWKRVEEIVVPSFNTLVLFDIQANVGRPHYVSHIAPQTPSKRIAFTGWFK
jgi:SM-20-related protein